jgi:hypothetical protein
MLLNQVLPEGGDFSWNEKLEDYNPSSTALCRLPRGFLRWLEEVLL